MLLCILHKLVIGFAVVGVINGVFIQAPTREADGLEVGPQILVQPKLLDFSRRPSKSHHQIIRL